MMLKVIVRAQKETADNENEISNDIAVTSLEEYIFKAIPDINDLSRTEIMEDNQVNVQRIVFEPLNNPGQETMYLSNYKNYLTLGYDFFEMRYDFSKETFEKTVKKVVYIVDQILREQLMALTTYSNNKMISPVSNLYRPIDAKRVQRGPNLRIRSWAGTYDEGR